MPWPVRGTTRGGPDRFSSVYTGPASPGWTSDYATLGVAPVPLSRRRVVILGIGESGMVGAGPVTDPLPTGYPPVPNGLLWTCDTSRGWLPLAEPAHPPNQGNGLGAGGMFCWLLQQTLGDGYEVAFVPTAWSSTRSADWLPDQWRYTAAKNSLLTALALPRTVFGGILFEQGIGDASNGLAEQWAGNWSTIESQLRADTGGSAVPMYYARQHNARAAGTTVDQWATLLAAQDAWEAPLRIKVVKPEGPWTDAQSHLNAAGQTVLAQRYMAAWNASPGVTI